MEKYGQKEQEEEIRTSQTQMLSNKSDLIVVHKCSHLV